MTAIGGPALRAYVVGGIVGLGAGLAVGDPAPAILGGALLAVAAIGLAGGPYANIEAEAAALPRSLVEGRTAVFEVRVATDRPVGRTYLDLGLELLDIADVEGARRVSGSVVTLPRLDEEKTIRVSVVATGWGRSGVGPIRIYSQAPMGMFDLYWENPTRHVIVSVPEETTLKTLLSPLETNLHLGDLVSVKRGGGSEFADLREFRHGDDPRAVNWRVSSRAGSLWVNERHPERNGDVLVLVDAQVETGTGLVALVDRSVRMAAALLETHARHRHRVGLITLDGLCRWIHPGLGEQHRHQLLEQLMGVDPGEIIWEAAERAVMRAARRPALVIALSSLTDPNVGGLLHSLRRGGIDVALIAMDVETSIPPPGGEARGLGRRIWSLEREMIFDRLAGEGIPAVSWREIDPPEVPLARLAEMRVRWRRHV